MSNEKLCNLKKQLEDIVKAIDEDYSPTFSTRASQELRQPHVSQAARQPSVPSTSSSFASRAVDNFRYVCHLS